MLLQALSNTACGERYVYNASELLSITLELLLELHLDNIL